MKVKKQLYYFSFYRFKTIATAFLLICTVLSCAQNKSAKKNDHSENQGGGQESQTASNPKPPAVNIDLQKTEDIEKQITDIKIRVERNPNDSENLFALARFYGMVEKWSDAGFAFEQYYALKKDDIKGIRGVVYSYIQNDEMKKATAFLENLIKDVSPDSKESESPFLLETKLVYAHVLILGDDLTHAKDLCEEVLDKDHKNGQAYIWLAEIARLQKNYKLAKLLLAKAKLFLPQSAQIPLIQAKIEWEKDNLSNAVKYYQKVVELDPKNIEARMILAKVFYDNRAYGASELHLAEILHGFPKHLFARNLLAQLYIKTQRYEPAEKLLVALTEETDKDSSLFFNLGILYLRYLNQVEKAQEYFKKFVSMEPAAVVKSSGVNDYLTEIDFVLKAKKEDEERKLAEQQKKEEAEKLKKELQAQQQQEPSNIANAVQNPPAAAPNQTPSSVDAQPNTVQPPKDQKATKEQENLLDPSAQPPATAPDASGNNAAEEKKDEKKPAQPVPSEKKDDTVKPQQPETKDKDDNTKPNPEDEKEKKSE